MHCSQVITDPGCSMLTFTLRWLRWPGNSTVLIGLGAGDAIWWWILKRSRQLLQSKAIPLGYMLSKMHLIMPLSLSVCVSLSHSFPLSICWTLCSGFILSISLLQWVLLGLWNDIQCFAISALAFLFALLRLWPNIIWTKTHRVSVHTTVGFD